MIVRTYTLHRLNVMD